MRWPVLQDELSPAMQRRRKRAKAARASLTAGTKQAAWAPVSEHSDEVLSQVLVVLCSSLHCLPV